MMGPTPSRTKMSWVGENGGKLESDVILTLLEEWVSHES
jgi:hypothetical protein